MLLVGADSSANGLCRKFRGWLGILRGRVRSHTGTWSLSIVEDSHTDGVQASWQVNPHHPVP